MKLLERLERCGWVYVNTFSHLEVLGRKDKRLLYDVKKDEITLVYGPTIAPHKPMSIDVELLCEKLEPETQVKQVKKKMIYAHFYGNGVQDEEEKE